MDVSDEFIEKNSWMVRPCAKYKEEYNDCTSIRSRLYQYFINGEFTECKQWKRDYNNCENWTKYKDSKGFKEIIESELSRRNDRLKAHFNNDVWEKREIVPPPGWNGPLPEFIEKRMKNSYITAKVNAEKEGYFFCSIS